MSRGKKTGAWLAAAALCAALAVSAVYVGSVLAGKKGVGEQTEVFALSIGSGPAQIGYVEADSDLDAWGPSSFAVLRNGDVAILDAANRRLLVVDQEGAQVRSVDYERLGLVCPADLYEWRGRLAVASPGYRCGDGEVDEGK